MQMTSVSFFTPSAASACTLCNIHTQYLKLTQVSGSGGRGRGSKEPGILELRLHAVSFFSHGN